MLGDGEGIRVGSKLPPVGVRVVGGLVGLDVGTVDGMELGEGLGIKDGAEVGVPVVGGLLGL